MKRFCTFFVILVLHIFWFSIAEAQTVWMPDANLAALVRDELGLAPNAPITREAMRRLTFLDAQSFKVREVTGQEGWIENITGLEHATRLRRLWLNNNRIRDIGLLSRLIQLEELHIWNNQIQDISPLAGLKWLTSLHIFDNPINDFSPLAELTELQRLGVSVNRVSNLRRHVDLGQLELLWLDGLGNRIEDLGLLSHLTQLRRLEVTNAQVRDLSFLERLTQLESLSLGRNDISDLKPLADLTQLVGLRLSSNDISDLKPLADLTQLESLDLGGNDISDLKPLADLTELRYLYLWDNQVGDVSPLAGLVNLEALYLGGNPVEDASPLASLTKLRHTDIDIPEPPLGVITRPVSTGNVVIPDANLAAAVRKALGLGSNAAISKQRLRGLTRLDARDSQIRNLTGLEHATGLRVLELRDNQISNIRPLVNLKNLNELILDNNRVRDIRPLTNMKQLTWLLIGKNPISDFTPIKNLTELRGLSFWGNDVSNASLFAGLTKLTHLWLGANKISNITPLADLVNLEVLSLHDNRIRDISPLAGLVNLETLHLNNNPIQDTSPLRKLLDRNPNLDLDINLDAGPKIEGPWVWMIASTEGNLGPKAASSGKDWLAAASGGSVTEQQIVRNGAPVGNAVGNKVWTLGRITSTGNNNITEMVNATGLGKGNYIEYHVAYGSISLDSPREQNTTMYVGSDDSVKVWLNGVLVHNNPADRGADNYQENFSVTLKQGRNILVVAVYNGHGGWSGFFGFKKDAVYSLAPTSVVHVDAAQRPPLYWIGATTRTLHRLVGDEVENLVPSVRNATNLAMDVAGGRLYWTEKTSNRTGRIRRANLDGTGVQLVKNLTSVPNGIALDAAGGKIYVTNAWGKIQRLNVDGSNFQPNLITDLEMPGGLALDISGGKVYWTEVSGRVRRANFDGSNIEDLPAGPGTPMNIAVSESTVYWTVKTGEERGEIRFANLIGSPNVTTYAEFNQGFPIGIAVDPVAEKLYWTLSRGKIGRGNIDESSFQPDVVTGLGAPGAFAVSVDPPLVVETPEAATTDAVVRLSPSSVVSPAVRGRLTLDLSIMGGEAVAGYQLTLQFDPTALRYVESGNGDYLPDGAFFVPPVVNRGSIELASTTLAGESSGDGTLSTVTFEIMAVKASTLTLSETLLSDSAGNTFRPQVEGGEITEPPELKGDVNGDGVVNIQDLVLVASNFGGTGQNVADVNGDDVVNIADLVLVAGALGTSAAAPLLYPDALEMLTTADVRQWLSQAHQLDLTAARTQQGIRYLEQLLAVLTPKETVLLANYPNPFNPETWIPYQLAKSGNVNITIYDARGAVVRRLAFGHQPAGHYTNRSRAAYWDGRNTFGEPVASGLYFYTFTAGGFTATRKMLIRK